MQETAWLVRRPGFVIYAASIEDLARQAYERLLERPDMKKLYGESVAYNEALEQVHREYGIRQVTWPEDLRLRIQELNYRDAYWRALHGPLVELLGRFPESYKLFPWVVREIKRMIEAGRIPDDDHIVDIVGPAGRLIHDMRRNNRLPQGFDVNQMDFDMLERWLYEQQGHEPGEGGGEVVHTFEDGWRIMRLHRPEQLDYDTKHLEHCVGLGGYDNSVKDGRALIYSVRDARNIPQATIEIAGKFERGGDETYAWHHGQPVEPFTTQDEAWEVVQIQGARNSHPDAETTRHIREWVLGLRRQGVELENNDYYYGDSRVIKDAQSLLAWYENAFFGDTTAETDEELLRGADEFGLVGGSAHDLSVEWEDLDMSVLAALYTGYDRANWHTNNWRGLAQAYYAALIAENNGRPIDPQVVLKASYEFEEKVFDWAEEVMDYSWEYFTQEAETDFYEEFAHLESINDEGENVGVDLEELWESVEEERADHPEYGEWWEEKEEKFRDDLIDSEYGNILKFANYLYHLGQYGSSGRVPLQRQPGFEIPPYERLMEWNNPESESDSADPEIPGALSHWSKTALELPDDNVHDAIYRALAADPAAKPAWSALQAAGGQVYVVGGAIRDALLGKPPKDVDLMVAGLPAEQVELALTAIPNARVDYTGRDFGVFRVKVDGGEVEVALPRTERSVGGGHRDFDVQVDFNLAPEDDLARRDFTGNAMALHLDSGTLIDPYGGRTDLQGRILRTVSPQSFRDDPLRIVRALVAYARHGLEPDATTVKQMYENADQIRHLPGERIQAELQKLLASDNPAQALKLAAESGVLRHILPEVAAAMGVNQYNRHHELDVGSHLLAVLDHMVAISHDPDLRLAALLHDIGKPDSLWIDAEGQGHFYEHPDYPESADHDELGAEMAEALMRRLRYPQNRIERVKRLIRLHMFPAFKTKKGARRLLNMAGDEQTAYDLLRLREADLAGKGRHRGMEGQDATDVQQMRELLDAVVDSQEAFTIKDLAVDGNDLMEMGIEQGPEIGALLRQLMEYVLEFPEANNKNDLLAVVRQLTKDV